jgi:two-component system, NtrC family, sensor histidine kinase GlrK
MKIRLSSSIRQLTLLGFFLVVIPLMVALISTVFQVDGLAVRMQKTVRNSAQAVEASRLITMQALSMERSAEQYGVLYDPALLEHYQTQRTQLTEAIARLSALPISTDLSSRLKKLSQREEALSRQLKKWAGMPENNVQKLDLSLKLAEIVRPIPSAVTAGIVDDSEAINLQIERVQQMLLWQGIALTPLALILAGIFSTLITRPLAALGTAIRRLGAGELAAPVKVSGPQDVRELGEQLDWMRRRLAELDQQKLFFLQHVSHELKTPLTAIREGAGLLCDNIVGPLNEEQTEVVKILQESSLLLQTQVEGLLNFNLAMVQDKPAQLQPVDLVEIIHEVIKNQQLAMRPRHIRVTTDLHPIEVSGEPEKLRAVVDNILSNAIKYSPDAAEIKINLGTENKMACLDVIDQGVGINAENRQLIFEPFFQGKQIGKSPVKGTGLGLAIAQRYVRLHKGSIRVMESSQGAHIRVFLPLAITGEEK